MTRGRPLCLGKSTGAWPRSLQTVRTTPSGSTRRRTHRVKGEPSECAFHLGRNAQLSPRPSGRVEGAEPERPLNSPTRPPRVAHAIRLQPARHGREHDLSLQDDHRPSHGESHVGGATRGGATRLPGPQHHDPARHTRQLPSGVTPSRGTGDLSLSAEPCTNACAGKARSRGTRCRDVIFETLFETLWVSNPIRPRSAASRNRVMRGPGVTQGAKRSQGARSRVIEPRNALFVRADVVRWTEGYLAASQRPWRRRPRRGRSAWHACGWVSREPGRPRRLILKTAGGRAPAHQARGRGRSTWRPTERSRRCSDGTAGPKATKRGGMDGEESECLIVPPKRGN